MGGRSGSAIASTTILAVRGGRAFAVTPAQRRLIVLAKEAGGWFYVRGRQVISARHLVTLGLATLRDDGPMGPSQASNLDGERWWFELYPDVELKGGVR